MAPAVLTVPDPASPDRGRKVARDQHLALDNRTFGDPLSGVYAAFIDAGPARVERDRTPMGPVAGVASGGIPDYTGTVFTRFAGPRVALSGIGGPGGIGGLGLGSGGILGAGGPQLRGMGGIAGMPAMERPWVGAGAAVGAGVDDDPAWSFGLPAIQDFAWLASFDPMQGYNPKAAARLRAKLGEAVTIEKEFVGSLKEALELLQQRTKVPFVIEGDGFRGIQIPDVGSAGVTLAKADRTNLGRVLRRLLSQVQGTYLVRRDHIEIVTQERAALERRALFYPVSRLGPFACPAGPDGMEDDVAAMRWPSSGWKNRADTPAPGDPSSANAPDDLLGVFGLREAVPIKELHPLGASDYQGPEAFLAHLTGAYSRPPILYRRPCVTDDARMLHDLMAYVPGLQTTRADVLEVLETETAGATEVGHVDLQARRLIDRARTSEWNGISVPAERDRPALTIAADGQGRCAYERILPWGLEEQVYCDGQSLWQLYPELLVGSRRQVSRP